MGKKGKEKKNVSSGERNMMKTYMTKDMPESWAERQKSKNLSTYAGGYFYSKCDHPPECIYILGNVEYYASDIEGSRQFNGDLIFRLMGSRDSPLSTPAGFESLQKNVLSGVPNISLSWPDGGVPPVSPAFWYQFHELVVKNKMKKVLVHCFGGHGRTGTALAAFLISASGMSPDKAIAFIRKNHCDEAIETVSQEKYLERLPKLL